MAFIISVEGNIGSGKSTFLKYLKENSDLVTQTLKHPVVFVQEPVDEWNNIKDAAGESIIQKFYSNQEEYAFSFQIMAYITRLRKLMEAIEKNPSSIVICERSLETDKYVFAKMLYDSKKIREIDWVIYNYWFDTFLEKVKTDLIIYINTEPEICNERIIKRSRKGEEGIPLEYLQNCHKYHTSWLDAVTIPIIIFKGQMDINENSYKLSTERILTSIKESI